MYFKDLGLSQGGKMPERRGRHPMWTGSNKLCIPFEESLTEAQLTTFHKLLDCVSETASAEMRAVYKVGFKDGVAMMREVQE